MKGDACKLSVIDIILADDHSVVLKGLQAFFETEHDISVVSIASSGIDAVKAVEKHQPKVILLDLFLPDQKASETIKQMKIVSPATQVIILTSHEGTEYISDILKAGALSYILKDIGPEELVATVRKAEQGERVVDPRLTKILTDSVENSNYKLLHRLTERENEVMQLIARGLSNGEISKKLFVSEATVKSHVSSILGKLYMADRTKLAAYAWEHGIVKKNM